MSTVQSVVVWGELLWDRFPDGARLGGAPANVAWHLGQAGGWVQLVSRVGDDEDGRRAIELLSDVVDTGLVQLDDERATGEVLVEIAAGGDARYKLVPGRAWERIACTEDVEEAVMECGVFVYGTLAQRTAEGIAGWRQAIAATKGGAQCLRVCDVNLRPMDRDEIAVREAIDAADIVKVNDKELAALAAWWGWKDPVAELRARAEIAVVTHGAAGSTIYVRDGGRVVEIAGVPAAAGGDNVGCGDAYVAIVVHGLTMGWDVAASGRAAARWASAVAGVRGATPVFDRAAIARLLQDDGSADGYDGATA
jgi:fructokinase